MVADSQATNVKFFGKIFGIQKDYYIVEGVLEGGDEEGEGAEEKPADFEARGTGINKFVYWVTDNGKDDGNESVVVALDRERDSFGRGKVWHFCTRLPTKAAAVYTASTTDRQKSHG